MAWTSPATWVANTILTAAQLNEQVRDNLKAIGDPMTSYTPTWSAITTPPAIGNGTITGKYLAAGKFIRFRVTIAMGSTTTYGSGQYTVSLPFAAHGSGIQIVDTLAFGGTSYFGKGRITAGATAVGLYTPATTAGDLDRLVTATVPFAFANGDSITVCGTYEAA